ncbi:helix-turn-helix domain-containing protein [Acidiphilium sp. PA]|uniref:helix-turn-helix transcriptional regulator n=1 Tax=Acidiphilium sp. PA TaxID=2871705 RepID=UPI0022445885|nr:helix-turn-helix transcriptional regulator [Acidiphilium sp. PA]MCW8309592.1 helix-turn-helix domain-containing protein [Acidiphilium sp. PA]
MKTDVDKLKRKKKRFAENNIDIDRDDLWYEKFQKARLQLGLSQRDIADIIGVTHTAVCLWEKGDNFPSKKRFDQIEELLGSTIFDRGKNIFSPSRDPDYIVLMKLFKKLSEEDKNAVISFASQLLRKKDETTEAPYAKP